MSYYQNDSRFNDDWSAKDELTMLNYLAVPRMQQPHTCGWIVSGEPCNNVLFPDQFSGHLATHGVQGNNMTKMLCCWVGCNAPIMKKESLLRHVFEVHLELRFECPDCGMNFTRKASLNNHRKRQHFQQEHEVYRAGDLVRENAETMGSDTALDVWPWGAV